MFRKATEVARGFVGGLGEVVLLLADSVQSLFIGKPRWRLFLEQVVEVGTRSQAVVVVTGIFTGSVFAAQTFFQFHKLGMDSAVGAVVSISMCRELGPVLTGLMVAGRVGAAMTAEIGTMKVTEQIDALRALGVYPTDYLVVPRMLAMLLSLPLLVGEAIGFGILAGLAVSVNILGVGATYYVRNMVVFTGLQDLQIGLVKAVFFGLIIVMVGCHRGLGARDGAVGVGRATTAAVVVASLAILVSNFFLTMALNIVFPATDR